MRVLRVLVVFFVVVAAGVGLALVATRPDPLPEGTDFLAWEAMGRRRYRDCLVDVFAEHDFMGLVDKVVTAAADRSRELGG